MQYYHYFTIDAALDYLITDHFRISIPNSINDPFEFLPNFIKTKDENILRKQALKDNIAQWLISKFSKDCLYPAPQYHIIL